MSAATTRTVTRARGGVHRNSNDAPCLGEAVRRALIRQAAYLRAERRGFAPGHERDDWLQAEREIDQALAPQECEP